MGIFSKHHILDIMTSDKVSAEKLQDFGFSLSADEKTWNYEETINVFRINGDEYRDYITIEIDAKHLKKINVSFADGASRVSPLADYFERKISRESLTDFLKQKADKVEALLEDLINKEIIAFK